MNFDQFTIECKFAGLETRDCGCGHWQIINGKRVVNCYPYSRRGFTIYVSGTSRAQTRNGSVQTAINYAKSKSRARRKKRRRRKRTPYVAPPSITPREVDSSMLAPWEGPDELGDMRERLRAIELEYSTTPDLQKAAPAVNVDAWSPETD